MSVTLPKLPERGLLADLCREAAARERLQPQLIEKDFYLTRLLWALGQVFGEELLLKGGTLLSKVDLGFLRMSEDADLVLPGTPHHPPTLAACARGGAAPASRGSARGRCERSKVLRARRSRGSG